MARRRRTPPVSGEVTVHGHRSQCRSRLLRRMVAARWERRVARGFPSTPRRPLRDHQKPCASASNGRLGVPSADRPLRQERAFGTGETGHPQGGDPPIRLRANHGIGQVRAGSGDRHRRCVGAGGTGGGAGRGSVPWRRGRWRQGPAPCGNSSCGTQNGLPSRAPRSASTWAWVSIIRSPPTPEPMATAPRCGPAS